MAVKTRLYGSSILTITKKLNELRRELEVAADIEKYITEHLNRSLSLELDLLNDIKDFARSEAKKDLYLEFETDIIKISSGDPLLYRLLKEGGLPEKKNHPLLHRKIKI